MGKQNKLKKKDAIKSNVETVGKIDDNGGAGIPSLISVDAPVAKLTKQQKRDLKRKVQLTTVSNGVARSKDIKENTSVYRRTSLFPPEFTSFKGHKDRFVRPTDKQYNEIIKTSYSGFVLGKPEIFKPVIHDNFRSALEALETDSFYQFDLTQPTGLGTKVAKTFVTRCLVGDPGITYKYLGLRMFAHPWTEGEIGATKATVDIGKRNQDLIRHTEKLLKESGREEVGSCQYNLTLVNRCFPDGCDKVVLKEEPLFKKDKCTVSWHADSSLDHYSSIGVYHCTKERETPVTPAPVVKKFGDKNNKHKMNGTIPSSETKSDNGLWELSMRLHFNAEGPNAGKPVVPFGDAADNASKTTPAVAVPLPDQHSYFLLDDFNHHHQHSVLAGSTDRYASTHRVSRLEGHTFDYIRNKCQAAIQQKCDLSVKSLRSEQLALDEVEFEWIRQFYVQGPLHHQLHSWWHGPMAVLLELWHKLELRTQIVIQALRDAAVGVEDSSEAVATEAVTTDETAPSSSSNNNNSRKKLMKRSKYAECVSGVEAYDEMASFLSERQFKRDGWHERTLDPLYKKQTFDCRPMSAPFPLVELTQPYVPEVPPPPPVVVAPPIAAPASHKEKGEKRKERSDKKPRREEGEAAGGGGGGLSHTPAPPPAPRHPHQSLHEVSECIAKWRELFAARMREDEEEGGEEEE